MSTLAGSGKKQNSDGDHLTAAFDAPTALALHPRSGAIFVTCHRAVRTIDPTTYQVSTIASGSLFHPHGIAVDAAGHIFVADRGTDKIYHISPDTGLSAAMRLQLHFIALLLSAVSFCCGPPFPSLCCLHFAIPCRFARETDASDHLQVLSVH